MQSLCGQSPGVRFCGIPLQLDDIGYMGSNRMVGKNEEGDILAWDMRSGGILFFQDHRDLGE